jgi:hypothetical protein
VRHCDRILRQGTLQQIVDRFIKPHLGAGKPYRGVRLADEICRDPGCLAETLGPVAAFLRVALGPEAVLSTQETNPGRHCHFERK